MNARSELQFIEIDDETDGDVEQFHVAEKLGFVNGEHLDDGFRFDENAVFDEEVETQRFFSGEPFVVNNDGLLTLVA